MIKLLLLLTLSQAVARPLPPFGTTDQYFAITTGQLPGWTAFGGAGVNRDVDIGSVPEDIWGGGGLFPYQAAAQFLEAVSASANDTAAGTGARTVLIIGVDSTWAQIQEVVVLNGTTPVSTVNQFLRVNLFRTLTSGSGGTNAGDITLRVIAAGATQALMRAGDGQCLRSIFTVPLGFTAYLLDAIVSIIRAGSGESAEVSFYARTNVGPWVVRNVFAASNSGSSTSFIQPRLLGALPEKSDLRFAVTNVTADNTIVGATFIVLLKRN